MNLQPGEDQTMIAETFAKFLQEHSSTLRVRAALPSGFDPELWAGLAELGAFAMRIPADNGGLGLGLIDVTLLMEEAGRRLASGPIAEAIVAARLLALLGGGEANALAQQIAAGSRIATIALHDAGTQPAQWVAGGAVADAVIAREGDRVLLVRPSPEGRSTGPNLASAPLARIALDGNERTLIGSGPDAVALFEAAVEEWKLLTAAALAGLAREAIQMAAGYASERKAFGQLIGTYQAISHPLADLIVDADGGKYMVWKTICDIAEGKPGADAHVSLALWWLARTASKAAERALHTYGGYGLTLEYDIHLYVVRARGIPLMLGDSDQLLWEAGRRLYGDEHPALPEVGTPCVDFDLGEKARALAGEVDAFFRANLTPELKARAHYSYAGHDAGIHRKLAEARLLFPAWPPEHGGRSADPYAVAAIAAVWEEHEWSAHAASTSNMVGFIMQRFGSDELKAEALARVAAGEAVCSLGFSEPGSGSDVFAAVTRATPDGNGWRIDGQKMFTSGAEIADYVLLLARTDFDAPKHKGLTMFIVPLNAKGVEIQPVHTFQDEQTNITYYDAVHIPDSYRLGEVGGGLRVMAASLELEHGFSFVKTQAHLLREAERFCRETERNGQSMIADPAVARRLARVAAHIAIGHVISCRAMWTAVEKRPNLAYGPAAKMFSSEKFVADSGDLLDLAAPESLAASDGAAAFINQCYRHAQATTIYGGTSEVHRSMIAERQLGLPRTRA
ncbi:acyl-CoA dehydrogenase [Sphingomonas flavalba]|uniref:acyl-CoA dehydrogenase n=1 Tax=Sphingomonas flavalba TaxID=2559804 RepID=UPI0039DF86D6